MKITIEKGVCPKCKGLRKEREFIGFENPKLSETVCSLCEGEGLIVIKTIEEIEEDTKKK